jgi:hypothetical protein
VKGQVDDLGAQDGQRVDGSVIGGENFGIDPGFVFPWATG